MSFGKFKDAKNLDQPSKQEATSAKVGPGTASSVNGSTTTVIGQGATLVGNMQLKGCSEIAGQVEGEVVSEDRIIIAETAVVDGQVRGAEVIVYGTVNGDITAERLLALKDRARVTGNISSSALVIEEGVYFDGKCSMQNAQQTASKPGEIAKAANA